MSSIKYVEPCFLFLVSGMYFDNLPRTDKFRTFRRSYRKRGLRLRPYRPFRTRVAENQSLYTVQSHQSHQSQNYPTFDHHSQKERRVNYTISTTSGTTYATTVERSSNFRQHTMWSLARLPLPTQISTPHLGSSQTSCSHNTMTISIATHRSSIGQLL